MRDNRRGAIAWRGGRPVPGPARPGAAGLGIEGLAPGPCDRPAGAAALGLAVATIWLPWLAPGLHAPMMMN